MRVIVLLAVISAALGAPQNVKDGDLDALIASVYGSGPQTTTTSPDSTVTKTPQITSNSGSADYCECVPYYQCLNNTISTEGIGLIDIRCGGNNRSE